MSKLKYLHNKNIKILGFSISISLIFIIYNIWNLVFSKRIKINDGCGWDGSQYCEMFYGNLVMEPYSRRILAPWIVNALFDDPINGFFFVNFFTIILSVILIFFLLTMSINLSYNSIQLLLIISAITVYIFSKHGLRLNYIYPVLTEHLYFFFILAVIFLLFTETKNTNIFFKYIVLILLILFSLAAGLTRESLGPILIIFSVWLLKNKLYLKSLSVILGASLSTYISFNQPTNSPAAPFIEIFIHWFRMNLAFSSGFFRFSTMLLIALGPFVFLLNQRILKSLDLNERILLTFTFIFTATSALGGGDTDRILFPAGILLSILLTRFCLRIESGYLTVFFLLLTYFSWNLPFKILNNRGDDILSVYGFRVTTLSNVYEYGIMPILTTIPLLLITFFYYQKEFKKSVIKSN